MRCRRRRARGKLAGADSGDYRITYLDRAPGRLQRLVALRRHGAGQGRHIDGAWPDRHAADTARECSKLLWLAELAQQRRPFALAVHCLCGDPEGRPARPIVARAEARQVHARCADSIGPRQTNTMSNKGRKGDLACMPAEEVYGTLRKQTGARSAAAVLSGCYIVPVRGPTVR
jgi:hypothetical protein